MFGLMFNSKQKQAPAAQVDRKTQKIRQTFTNQDAINFMRRYNTADQ